MGEADGYRLAPVQKVRALDERAKQGDLAGAVGDATKTQAKIDVATARVEALRAAITRARDGVRERLVSGSSAAGAGSSVVGAGSSAVGAGSSAGSSANAIALAERHLARLRRDLDAALGELDRATAAHRGQMDLVDAARAKLARARADKEIVERHFARWRDEKRKLAERRED